MRRVAESFAWPFRQMRTANWTIGLGAVLCLPLTFIPLLGYAVAATRAAEDDPAAGPPPWRIEGRLLRDGFWMTVAILLTVLPFALVLNPLAGFVHDRGVGEPAAHAVAFFVLALPWGFAVLLLLPHSTAAFAASGDPRDLFDAGAALREVRRDFALWNMVAAAIVTGWAAGLACVGLLCVGLVPGVFYAILVSAHATATLHRPGPRAAAR